MCGILCTEKTNYVKLDKLSGPVKSKGDGLFGGNCKYQSNSKK